MRHRRTTLGAGSAAQQLRRLLSALACAALLLASACAGVRSSERTPAAGGKPPTASELRLVISRDYGARVFEDILVPARAGMTVMRLLAEHAQVDTKYGGGFIQGIDGLASSFGGSSADAADWFYWVDGAMGTVGAADAALHGGQTVWWDYHRWAGAMFIPGALDAFPAPFKNEPLTLAVGPASSQAGPFQQAIVQWAQQRGLQLRGLHSSSPAADSGPWLIAGTPDWLARLGVVRASLARGTGVGVFVAIDGGQLYALGADGKRGPALLAAALAVPDTDHPGRLSLVLIARDVQALQRLLDGFTPAAANAHVALGLTDAGIIPLPLAAATGS